MTNEELLSVAEIVEKLTDRFNAQAAVCRERRNEYDKLIASMNADYEAKMVEHRAAFGARTEADAKIIEGLRVQVQDMREEIIRVNDAHGQTLVECDALRAEVAALQERLRASIARGDFAQMELALLKSSTPKHPAKVGEWIKRTAQGPYPVPTDPIGAVRQVISIADGIPDGYEYVIAGGRWHSDYCEPCDPPQTEPVPKRAHPVAVGGYLRRLTGFNTTPAGEVAQVTLVDDYGHSLEYEVVRPNGEKGRWSAKGCEPCDPPATHDTEAGKASAESAVRTEPVAEEIKVWDVVEVYQATGKHTAQNDVGFIGTVGTIHLADRVAHVRSGLGMPHMVDLCDVRKVRKVTT